MKDGGAIEFFLEKGGSGSGNFAHAGRPGEQGGSGVGSGLGRGNEVARTILDQMGGNRLVAMTGAKDFVVGDKNLSFRIPRAANGINHVSVKLEPTDTYSVEFSRVQAGKVTSVSSHTDVPAENLRELFEDKTGLTTYLGKGGSIEFFLKGGSGSGNFGHQGRPGEQGGSGAGSGSGEDAGKWDSTLESLPEGQSVTLPKIKYGGKIRSGWSANKQGPNEVGLGTTFRLYTEKGSYQETVTRGAIVRMIDAVRTGAPS